PRAGRTDPRELYARRKGMRLGDPDHGRAVGSQRVGRTSRWKACRSADPADGRARSGTGRLTHRTEKSASGRTHGDLSRARLYRLAKPQCTAICKPASRMDVHRDFHKIARMGMIPP